jgi:hypothetical protein
LLWDVLILTSPARVAFAGLARDCAHALPDILDSISQFGTGLQDWGYVFLENDSVDATVKMLADFDKTHRRGIVQSIEGLDQKYAVRTQRLAWLRNKCLEEVFRSERLSGFDYLIILDLDDANERFDGKRLLELFDTREPAWTAIFANQSERYYDIWALRHPTWSPDDCWKRIRERPEPMSREAAIDEYLVKRRKKLKHSGFIEVQSAFGGFGLYRLEALRDCLYVGLGSDGHEVCEHVAFHQDVTNRGGKLYIDCGLINGRGNQRHNGRMKLLTKAKRKYRQFTTQLRLR